MRRFGFLLLLAVVTGGGVVLWAYRSGVLGTSPGPAEPAAVERRDPAPGSPPVVWLDGTIEALGEDSLVLRQGDGAVVTLRRLAAGATSFHERDGAAWRETSREPPEGTRACIEALLDGEALVALRVFPGSAACGPG